MEPALIYLALALLAFGVFIWFQVKPLFVRIVSLAETRVEIAKPKVIDGDPMPAKLLTFAMGESEEWAKEATVKTMREMYDECRDWNVVYNQMLLREVRESRLTS